MSVSQYAYPLLDLVTRYQTPAIISATHELGVFAALGAGPADVLELACRLGLPERSLGILLRACVALGLLECHNGRFSNGPLARDVLVPDSPGYIGRLVDKEAFFYRAWANLAECVRTDTAALAPIRSRARWEPEATRNFLLALDDIASLYGGDFVPSLDLSGCRRLLDVGGGVGSYSIALAKRYPELQATILDLAEVVPWTEDFVSQSGVSDRITVQPFDFMSCEFPAGHDVILFSNIFHDQSPTVNQGLLSKAFRALAPGGKVVVYEFLLEPDRIAPPASAVFAVMMLVENPGGNVYTAEDIDGWMEGAGFSKPAVIRLPEPSPMGLLIATRS